MSGSTYFVMDVESNGLHGVGFAVGWVVVQDGKAVADGIEVAEHYGRFVEPWVKTHVVPALPSPTRVDASAVRTAFWNVWEYWHEQGAVLAADVPWPVEARFLAACIDDKIERRYRTAPYPLIDIASVRLAVGLDPLGTEERLANEVPEHNPLADARQSARLLVRALGRGGRAAGGHQTAQDARKGA